MKLEHSILGVMSLFCLQSSTCSESLDSLHNTLNTDPGVHDSVHHETAEQNERTKRQIINIPLVYPFGATYKLLIGFAAKVPNDDNVALLFAVNFQYQYVQIQNISTVSPYFAYLTVSRDERSMDDVSVRENERLVFYKAAEEMLTSKGFNGRECMLRAICEAAQYPVSEEGLIGEILHILLTPNYGRDTFTSDDKIEESWQDLMSEYISAQTAGSQMFHCASVYAGCPEGAGVMEIISELRDE